MKIGERGQITIPKAIRERFGFKADVEVDVKVKRGQVVIERKHDPAKFDAAVKRWRGTGAARMKSMGFKSTDDFMESLRGR